MSAQLNIVRRKQLEQRIGLGRSTIYERIDPESKNYDPDFPRPIKLGEGRNPPVGWLSHEVDAWIAARIAATRGTAETTQPDSTTTPKPTAPKPTDWRARVKQASAGKGVL